MTDAPDPRDDRGTLNKLLLALSGAIIARVVMNWLFGAVGSPGSGHRDHVSEADGGGRKEEYERELFDYVFGYGLAIVLTLVPFGLVNWSVMSQFSLVLAIGAFALAQAVTHFRYFLHIDPPKQNVHDLELILFSSLILFFMGGGTVWILTNLAMRMH